MPPSFTRWIRTRGILAVLAAAFVRCAPDVTPCVALPGASIIMTAQPALAAHFPGALQKGYMLALQGRAALLALAARLRGLAPTAFP